MTKATDAFFEWMETASDCPTWRIPQDFFEAGYREGVRAAARVGYDVGNSEIENGILALIGEAE